MLYLHFINFICIDIRITFILNIFWGSAFWGRWCGSPTLKFWEALPASCRPPFWGAGGDDLRATLADPASQPVSRRPTRFGGRGPFFAQTRPRIDPAAHIAVAGVPIQPPSTAIYSGRWGRCGSKTRSTSPLFPSPSLPRCRNSLPPATTNRLAMHRSTPRAPATCR
jgi:hypothetical protein